jgi:hypothetical protein
MRYLGSDTDLVNFLLLNKESSQLLTKFVYKHALLKCQSGELKDKRVSIWLNIMGIKSNESDYEALKAKVIQYPELIANVEEVILLDV